MTQAVVAPAASETPAPVAPVAPATPVPTPPPVTPAPVVEPAPVVDDEPKDTDDPNDTQLSKVRREAAAHRVKAREAQAEVTKLTGVLEALRTALDPEGAKPEVDPAAQAATLTAENAELRTSLLVHELAAENAANPNALLDSKTFTNKVAALDATAADYRTQVAAAITEAVTKNTQLRADQGSSRGGAEGAGQGAGVTPAVTKAQFDGMGYAQRAELATSNPTLYASLAG